MINREGKGEEQREKGREECETPTETFHTHLLLLHAEVLHCLMFFVYISKFKRNNLNVKK